MKYKTSPSFTRRGTEGAVSKTKLSFLLLTKLLLRKGYFAKLSFALKLSFKILFLPKPELGNEIKI